ncbi:helix-turn-helix transcriptional regulator [Paracoccus sp. TOH]|uniref:helix-turn-helix domain-containing protein n=1 Tax=Paracoccus sp. TOH TaxID=1263728 RepID=UPI0025B12E9C|nr:helix-turn-helix transcriptional regulator [Paracoccus sp. TOH]WJS86728.1 helix-turn-helix transcriptional regulator [Paracoccus sp. TOH]
MAMHPITQRIDALMEEQGMSKADLARSAGIPYHRLNPWFIRDNAKPNAEDIEAVAIALNVQPSFLISGQADGPRDERSWILSVYDNLPAEKRAQLEGFARFLADEAKGSQGTERKGKGVPEKADPDT